MTARISPAGVAIGGLVALTLAPMPPVVLTADVLRGALLLVASAAVVAWRAAGRPGETTAPHAHAAVVAVVVAGVGAAVLDADAAADPGVWMPWVLGPGLVAAWSTTSPASARRALVLGLAAVAVVALAQHLGAPLFGAAHAPFAGRRAIGTWGNPTITGVAVAAGLAGARGADADRLERLAIAGLAAAVVVSTSRIAWLGALVGVVAAGAQGAWAARRALAAGLGTGLAAALFVGASLIDRVADAPGAVAGRWDTLRASVRSMPGSVAWFGDGPGAFGRAWPTIAAQDDRLDPMLQHLHFDALEVAWAIGVPLAALGAVLVARRIGPALRATDARRAGAAMLVTLAVAGLAQPVLFVHATLAVAATAWWIARPLRQEQPTADRAPLQRMLVVLSIAALALCAPLAARRVASDAALYPAITSRAHPLDRATQDAVDRAVRLDPTNPRARLVRGLDPVRPDDTRCDDLRRIVRVRAEPSLVALRRLLRCE